MHAAASRILNGDRAALKYALTEIMLNALQANPADPKVGVRLHAEMQAQVADEDRLLGRALRGDLIEKVLERSAEKDLRRLPELIHDRIVRAINTLSRNPRPQGCRKLSGGENDWRIRVGDYRVIYEIADAHKMVRVNRVRHRREVYR